MIDIRGIGVEYLMHDLFFHFSIVFFWDLSLYSYISLCIFRSVKRAFTGGRSLFLFLFLFLSSGA